MELSNVFDSHLHGEIVIKAVLLKAMMAVDKCSGTCSFSLHSSIINAPNRNILLLISTCKEQG